MTVLLDTHVWIWWITGSGRLNARERTALDRLAHEGKTRVSAISLWEAQMLHARGRLELKVPFEPWIVDAADSSLVEVVPLDVSVVLELNKLPSDFPGDPADRIIAATARSRRLELATRDTRLKRSRLVKLWRA